MKRIFIIAFAGILCSGCSDDLYEFMNRNTNAPVVSTPQVECFIRECEIVVYWDEDEAADEYLLYRDTNPAGLFNNISYRGRDLSFKDTGLQSESGKLYYYKLAKRRAEQIFEKSDFVLGVSYNKRRDSYEPNNTPETATEFYNVINANIYYYRYDGNHKLEDVDWYRAEVEPHRQTIINVWYDENSDLEPYDIYYMEIGGSNHVVIDGDVNEIQLKNYENETCIKYFCIVINEIRFDGVGGKMGNYQIKFLTTEPLPTE